jgi:hypothetical protein
MDRSQVYGSTFRLKIGAMCRIEHILSGKISKYITFVGLKKIIEFAYKKTLTTRLNWWYITGMVHIY